MSPTGLTTESPATLVAIVIAARRAGDKELERAMRRELEDRHGVNLRFSRGKPRSHGYRPESQPVDSSATVTDEAPTAEHDGRQHVNPRDADELADAVEAGETPA